MIFVDLSEGLGNQMFQYAFSRSLQERYGDDIYLDTQSYRRNHGNRSFSLEHYQLMEKTKHGNIIYEKIMDGYVKLIRHILEKKNVNLCDSNIVVKYEKYGFYLFRDVFGHVEYNYNIKKRNKFVLGSWMNDKYFENIRELLIKDFSLCDTLDEQNQIMLEEIRNSNAVCVHIRLGDYLSPQWSFLNVCTEKYYKTAYEMLKEKLDNPVFYVFSNSSKDLKWIYDNYLFLRGCKFVDLKNKDFEDLELMKNCKHYIMSNSTYSWWAQYLCENATKIVIAPKIWAKGENGAIGFQINGSTLGIYQDNWTIVEQ